MPSHVDDDGLRRIEMKLDRLASLDSGDLVDLTDTLESIIIEDNRQGVLEGLDRDDIAAPPLKYRTGSGSPTRTRSSRSGAFGTTTKRFKGITAYEFRSSILPNNNLSAKMYKQLSGPRLAPRREASRTIANLERLDPIITSTSVEVRCGWVDVVSAKGVPFLHAHFTGAGRLPRYDLRGIRRRGMDRARKAVRDWVSWLLGH